MRLVNKRGELIGTELDGGIYINVMPNDYLMVDGKRYIVKYRVMDVDTDLLTFYIEESQDIDNFLSLGV